MPCRTALRDAALSALVAFGLFVALIGLRPIPTDQGLTLQHRGRGLWPSSSAAVFVGRLVLLGWRAWRPAGTATRRGGLAERADACGPLRRRRCSCWRHSRLPLYGGRY